MPPPNRLTPLRPRGIARPFGASGMAGGGPSGVALGSVGASGTGGGPAPRSGVAARRGGRAWEVLISTREERLGRALLVEPHPGVRLFQITANRANPHVARALDEPGRAREILLLELARRIIDTGRHLDLGVELLELQQILTTQRLNG